MLTFLFLEFAAVQIASEYANTKAFEQTDQLEAQQKYTFLMTLLFVFVPLLIINLSLVAFILINHYNCFKSNKKQIDDTTTNVEASVSDVSQETQSGIPQFSQNNIRHPSDDVQTSVFEMTLH